MFVFLVDNPGSFCYIHSKVDDIVIMHKERWYPIMKKILAMVLALAMILTAVAALAEAPEGAVIVEMPDVGMQFYRFEDMTVGEADEEQSLAYIASNDSLSLAVYVVGTNDMTMDDLAAALTEQGYIVEPNALTEAGLTYDHLCLSVDGVDNWAGVVFQGTDGYFYDFECEILDENGAYMFGMILGSLQPIA